MKLRLSGGQVDGGPRGHLCLLDSLLLLLASLARSGAQSLAATVAALHLVVVHSLVVSASLHEAASLVPPLADSARPHVDVEILSRSD